MSPMSAVDRRKYRKQQKLKQGYAATPLVPPPAASGPSQPHDSPSVRLFPKSDKEEVALKTSSSRPPPSQDSPPAKKVKIGPTYKLGLPLEGSAEASVAWKQVLQTRKRGSTPDSPVRSVFDARYPLNRVLSDAAGEGDVERVQSMGVKETITAVKSYGHYISVLSHLAEETVEKTLADHARLERDLKKVQQELADCKLERDQLKENFEKCSAEKTRLDGKVVSLAQEEKRLSEALEQAKKDWEAAQSELGKCNEALAGVAAHFPDLAVGSSLAVAVEELKESVASSFEDGFNLALAQMRVVCPGADESQFDVYKVVRDGRIVDEDEEPVPAAKETPPVGTVRPVDLAAVGEFLLGDEGLEAPGNEEGHAENAE